MYEAEFEKRQNGKRGFLKRKNIASTTVETDHKALEQLLSSNHLNARLTRWALYLQKFSRTIHYWASEASPTLGCSIKISRDIYIYIYICRYVVCLSYVKLTA